MPLTNADHDHAEEALRSMLLQRSICGVHFYGIPGAIPILLFDDPARSRPQSTWLTIESPWSTSATTSWVKDSAALAELASVATSLRGHPVVTVSLGVNAPHLLLTFRNGALLHVCGSNAQYESWNVESGDIMVVALPGDRVTCTSN